MGFKIVMCLGVTPNLVSSTINLPKLLVVLDHLNPSFSGYVLGLIYDNLTWITSLTE